MNVPGVGHYYNTKKIPKRIQHEILKAQREKEMEEGPDAEVVYSDETKEIVGYLCKKATVKIKEKNSDKVTEHTVYYTEELGPGFSNQNHPFFKDINGVMLEYSMAEDDIKMKFSAIKVEKKKVSESEFEIPEGYNVMTKAEFENMFGGY